MLKGVPDLRHDAAEAAEADHAERLAGEVDADRALPAAFAQAAVLGRQLARRGQDQRPGMLGGRPGQGFGAADRHAMLGRGGEIDRRVPGTRGHQQTQLGQRLEQCPRKGRPLAHRADDLEVTERRGDRRRIAEVALEHGDLGRIAQRRPIRHVERHPLVVVEDRQLHRALPPVRVRASA